ncbi:MAG: 50S ribosomal protein L25/general stress protein Ctc [Bacteroidales bacterium]|nr:50S ribosomal protein L25/general stress protein Ctc [Bacteroidales bacterium]
MKTFDLKGNLRTDLGKKASDELRKKDLVPCVLYGGGENVHFYTTVLALRDLVYTPNVYIVNLDIDGKKYRAVMREIQFHPVTDRILHIDFLQIFDDKPVVIDIPVKIVGNSVGVKKGGKLKIAKRYLKVKALPKHLPDVLQVNIEDLDVGQHIRVNKLNFENLTIINKPNELVVSVLTSRLVKEGAAAEGK